MLPIIAIVGRPNVGKSTLFNVLTRSRDAIVADRAGLTRDRKMARGKMGEKNYWVIDTGGLTDNSAEPLSQQINQQVFQAIEEAQCVLFLVDGRAGLTPADQEIAERLRTFNTPIYLVINKSEGLMGEIVKSDFYRLGFKQIHTISASHQQGVEALILSVESHLPDSETVAEEPNRIKVAVIGRPNVGKSTLINRILGYERVIAYDEPGTTRDSIAVPFERDGQNYTLIDTAGVRRRARVEDMIEKFSVIKTLQTIESTDVVIVLLDAHEGVTDQDANLLGMVLESGRALVIAVNKWDGLDAYQRDQVRHSLELKLHFIDFADIHFISAKHGSGVGNLFESIQTAWRSANCQISTARLNEFLEQALEQHQPPTVNGRRIKLRFMHQGGQCPPVFVIHGNQLNHLPPAYQRYLINNLRDIFKLHGTPINLVMRQGSNPFEGQKNELTHRQIKKRQRLMRFVKRK